jgi:glutamyl-tRNA synthetase
MLDFQSAVDDHLYEITHIIRGIDLQDSAKRQGFLYDYFGWEYPEVTHWGRIEVDEYDVPLSTSSIKELVEDGELDGWDDPRAPTLASLERRGIRGAAVVEAMTELGVSTANADLAMSSVYSANRELVDDGTDRAFLVRDGERLPVAGGPDAGHPPVHPEHEDRGTRDVPLDEAVLLEPGDVPADGERVWLKGWGPVRNESGTLRYTDESIDVVRKGDVDVVHWVDAEANVSVTMRTMDGDVTGHAEPGVRDYTVDDLLQFERVGFARVDATDDEFVVYFTHR